MGYTHYFPHTSVTDEVWEKIKSDCEKIVGTGIVPVEDDRDGSEPKFTDHLILFNGVGENQHETFCLEKAGSGGFAFCKTNRKPYNILVQACLLLYQLHSPETLKLGSDGSLEEWKDAIKLVTKTLGYKTEVALS